MSRPSSSPWSCFCVQCVPIARPSGLIKNGRKVDALGLPVIDRRSRFEHLHVADHLVDRAEAELRHDLAQFLGHELKKLTTYSGLPANFLRSSGSCVATPTGQVFRWHLRIMMQPSVISGAVAKPNSSAPEQHGIATSRPVISCPSHSTTIRLRRSFSTSV